MDFSVEAFLAVQSVLIGTVPNASAPPVDATRAEQGQRAGIAKWIRRLAVPIIVGWVALIAALNISVPQLEVVGKMQAVSMSPKEAPAVAAMMRIGKDF